MSHYARQDDIAWLRLEGFDGGRVYGENHEWGLVERERGTGRVVAVEFWEASRRLPKELLDALPPPRGDEVVVGSNSPKRQPA